MSLVSQFWEAAVNTSSILTQRVGSAYDMLCAPVGLVDTLPIRDVFGRLYDPFLNLILFITAATVVLILCVVAAWTGALFTYAIWCVWSASPWGSAHRVPPTPAAVTKERSTPSPKRMRRRSSKR